MSNSQPYNMHCQITDNHKFLLNISKFVSIFLHPHRALGDDSFPVVSCGAPPGTRVVWMSAAWQCWFCSGTFWVWGHWPWVFSSLFTPISCLSPWSNSTSPPIFLQGTPSGLPLYVGLRAHWNHEPKTDRCRLFPSPTFVRTVEVSDASSSRIVSGSGFPQKFGSSGQSCLLSQV